MLLAEHKQWTNIATITGLINPTYYQDESFFNLTNIPQGVAGDNRVGDKVTGTFLTLRFSMHPPRGATVRTDGEQRLEFFMRCIIFIFKDDTTPTFNQLFLPAAEGDQPLLLPLQAYNPDFKVKSKILVDFTVHGYRYSDGTAVWVVWKATTNMTIKVNLKQLKKGNNVIHFFQGSATGVNKIYYHAQSNIPLQEPDIAEFNVWDSCLISDYRFVDM